jgi:ethanolamine permease
VEIAGRDNQALKSIIEEVIGEAQIDPALILPEEIEYIRNHCLRKPLGVVHIWGLGVGSVIAGMFFGWNFGLQVAGPIGMLIASLVVCGLYLTWVLGLSELSVAMPFAGGPMTYGRRAFGRALGFFMGWSMFLECLFAAIGTALATGGYVAFLLNPDHPDPLTTTTCAIVCALLFLAVQYVGVKEQARITLWLTWAAIIALVWFWIAAIPGISLDRIFTTPLLTQGWSGVLTAVPYALWWLVIIESVALASEEAHAPHVTIPRGMVLAQITLAVMVVLTWFFASAAAPYKETGAVNYPLPLVLKHVWGTGWFLKTFSAVALTGLAVSYCGMLYATSRQGFSLGRAGYLPRVLGAVHATRRTPHLSLVICTILTIAFLIYGYFNQDSTNVAILISTLAAVIWYVLAMSCLLVLRRKEPNLHRPYRVPVFPWLVIFVGVLAAFAGYLYAWVNIQVLVPGAILYAGAAIWYLVRGRRTVLATAPEEVAARIADKFMRPVATSEHLDITRLERKQFGAKLGHYFTACVLIAGLLSLVWMVARATNVLIGPVGRFELTAVGSIWTMLFIVVSWTGFRSTHP